MTGDTPTRMGPTYWTHFCRRVGIIPWKDGTWRAGYIDAKKRRPFVRIPPSDTIDDALEKLQRFAKLCRWDEASPAEIKNDYYTRRGA